MKCLVVLIKHDGRAMVILNQVGRAREHFVTVIDNSLRDCYRSVLEKGQRTLESCLHSYVNIIIKINDSMAFSLIATCQMLREKPLGYETSSVIETLIGVGL